VARLAPWIEAAERGWQYEVVMRRLLVLVVAVLSVAPSGYAGPPPVTPPTPIPLELIYNPHAYVPGGSLLRVAIAIQVAGFRTGPPAP
jgi:hypothetical protein